MSMKQTDDGWVLNVKISPNSSKNEIIKNDDGTIKVKLTAQPIEGKANKALIEYLAKQLKIPKSSIEILKGQTSKDKVILIKNMGELTFFDVRKTLTIKTKS